jgi:predicted Zn-dependent protease with MMP-like domain
LFYRRTELDMANSLGKKIVGAVIIIVVQHEVAKWIKSNK